MYGKGIPVIVFDRDIVGDTYTARIVVDNEELGRSAAHYALHLLGSSVRAIEVYGLEGSTPAQGRHAGFAKELAAGGGRLVASASGDWNKEDAVCVADSLLAAYPDVNLIYAHNDRMAIGASEAAVRRGVRGSVKIIGIDAVPDIGIRAVADSVIDATFLYPTEGHRLIQTALAILKGEPFRREVLLPVSSAVDLTNADILLLQDETLKQETAKIRDLKERIDVYWTRYRAQRALSWASVSIIVLLLGWGLLLFRSYRQHARWRRTLTRQNRLLEEERDKQRVLNERLQEATREKLAFFTNVSHDLRTPLTLIAEPVSQMAGAGNLTERQHVLIRMADKNVRILRRLINQILDFRKYENGKLDLRLTETDFGRTVREWVESFHTLARKRDIKLSVEIPAPEESLRLALDTEKMERVFFNLLSNAFKHTPAVGIVSVLLLASTHIKEESVDKASGFGECLRMLGRPFIFLCFLGIMCHVGIDVGTNTTAPKIIMERLGLPLVEAGFATSVYFIFRTAGCFLGAFILRFVSPKLFFAVSTLMILAGMAILFTGDTLTLLYAGIGLTGFGNSNIFSIAFSQALLHAPREKNEVSGLMIMGLFGGTVFPLAMGYTADAVGGQAGAVAVMTAGVLYLLYYMTKIRKTS